MREVGPALLPPGELQWPSALTSLGYFQAIQNCIQRGLYLYDIGASEGAMGSAYAVD